jgi:hypothetical protein
VQHLRAHGFGVTVHETGELPARRAQLGMPATLASCHSAAIAGYAIEGHVPARDIKRLLEQKPKARGLAVPGMPGGSPGMESSPRQPYDVLLVKPDGSTSIFQSYR